MRQSSFGKRIQTRIQNYLKPEGKTEQGIKQAIAFLTNGQLNIAVNAKDPERLNKQV